MTELGKMIAQDGKRQAIFGGSALAVMLGFIGMMVVTDRVAWLGVIICAGLGASGILLLRYGVIDLHAAQNDLRAFRQAGDEEPCYLMRKRMYVGTKVSERNGFHLYDMTQRTYGEMVDTTPPAKKVLSAIAAIAGQTYSTHSLMPKRYQIRDEDGTLLFYVHKKGGMHWRVYLEDPHNRYVAYAQTEKKDKAKQITFVEGDTIRWVANSDAYFGQLTIHDQAGHAYVEMKNNGIPIEAPDEFDKVPGDLLNWNETENIPSSLVAFLFLLQTRY
ncbi:hypothetical protein [Thalassobacillus sp. CUG 92003]|uniref:hypothetical protein n=1 Tax=Thalassobacillus sp. CUG 92003 TaxID=2736641 RepID=UPI0015E7B3AF|nr:hypothetical protein [Thalassobacillus sp. CUG 92003]